MIGGNDWAAAWALDERGLPEFRVGSGYDGERQREMGQALESDDGTAGVPVVHHWLDEADVAADRSAEQVGDGTKAGHRHPGQITCRMRQDWPSDEEARTDNRS